MKRCLMIIVLVLTAAMALAAGDAHSSSQRVTLPTAVLSQDNGDTPKTDTTPLLATAAGLPMHICGTGNSPAKSSRHTDENSIQGTHGHAFGTNVPVPKAGTATYPICLTHIRAADRYIYFLHRIII